MAIEIKGGYRGGIDNHKVAKLLTQLVLCSIDRSSQVML
jgi:hypothetical protein